MNLISFKSIASLGLVAALGAGCGKPAASKPITLAQVEPTLTSAFQSASPGVRQESQAAAEAVRNQQPVQAYATLWALNTRPELTPQQRVAANQAMAVLQAQLRRTADSGDRDSQDLLKLYRATK
jgi:hypothetical protein